MKQNGENPSASLLLSKFYVYIVLLLNFQMGLEFHYMVVQRNAQAYIFFSRWWFCRNLFRESRTLSPCRECHLEHQEVVTCGISLQPQAS